MTITDFKFYPTYCPFIYTLVIKFDIISFIQKDMNTHAMNSDLSFSHNQLLSMYPMCHFNEFYILVVNNVH